MNQLHGLRQFSVVTFSVVSAAALVGCGGGSDRPKSYEDIRNAVESPTGTVDATSVKAIGPEVEKIYGTTSSGAREDIASRSLAQSASYSYDCDSGSISGSASGDSSNLTVDYSYDNCCYGDCCSNGEGNWYYSDLSSGTIADFSYCGSFDLTTTCGTDVSSVVYAGCFSGTGWTYAIEVNGESFAVTGNYNDGNGRLTITGANGTWECTYTDYSGTCTGEGESFDF